MSATKLLTTLYNPGEKDKQILIDEFVVRLREFDLIFDDIRKSKMLHPEQHYLLVGQRGAGKTTLIQRLRYAIQDDAKLSKWLIPLTFTEEQYNITELANLWESIAELLEDYHAMPGIVAEMQKHFSKDDYEEKLLNVLLAHLRKHKKKLVLFIDNIGDMLYKFSEKETRRFREVLMTIPDLRLVGASPVVLESVLDYHQPLLEFFKIIRLGSLNREEIETLLRKLAEKHNNTQDIEAIIQHHPDRIEILRRLTGGVVRTVVMMFNVFSQSADGNPTSDLNQILDDVTPLYKHKMDDLPIQQQKIVDVIAKNWESISTGEIAEKVRIESKAVSAQLKQLEKNQFIEKIATDTKNHLYQIKERFFNIWYLMRHGRHFDKNRVIWLVKFMESWLEKDELEKRIYNLIEKVKEKKHSVDTALLWSEVFLACKKISPLLKYELIQTTEEILSPHLKAEFKTLADKKLEILFQFIAIANNASEEDLARIRKSVFSNKTDFTSIVMGTILFAGLERNKKNQWLNNLLNLAKKDPTGFIDMTVGSVYSRQSNFSKAEQHLLKSIDKGFSYAKIVLAKLYFNNALKKEVALELIGELTKNRFKKDFVLFGLVAMVFLWNDKIEESFDAFELYCKTIEPSETIDFDEVAHYLGLLLAKEQFNLAYRILNSNPNYKMHFQPLYYALMYYMKDEYPNEILRMPPEMKETVDEVIKRVEEYRVKYK